MWFGNPRLGVWDTFWDCWGKVDFLLSVLGCSSRVALFFIHFGQIHLAEGTVRIDFIGNYIRLHLHYIAQAICICSLSVPPTIFNVTV